jgi:hypothetical protein
LLSFLVMIYGVLLSFGIYLRAPSHEGE